MSHPLRVVVLLASFQGARFIAQQLGSLTVQTHRHWRLVVSDDGSTDDTREIVQRFAASHPGRDIELRAGPRRGATRNFLSMLDAVEPGEALAWCDQDDVWHPDRLARGVAALAGQAAVPALRGNHGGVLHAARTTICDETLAVLRPAPLYSRPAGFANALVQACTPGNTMLVDPAGAALLRAARLAGEAAGINSHDWWSYQLISGAGGRVIRDPAQTVLYRQHRDNVMGRNDTPRAALARLARLGAGDYADWLRRNVAALQAAGTLSTPNRRMLDDFAAAIDSPGPVAAVRLARLGVYRQTRAGTAALLAAAAAGRLARRNPAPSG